MANDTRMLFSLIDSDYKLSEVDVSTDESISFLKKIIREEHNNSLLRDVDILCCGR
jgi:hypothetical protein